MMLDSLPRSEQFGCDDTDLAAINSLGEEIKSVNMLGAAAFLRWLPALRGHSRISFGKSTPAHVLAEGYRPKIIVRRAADALVMSAHFDGNETPALAGPNAWLLRGTDFLEIGCNLPSRLTSALYEPIHLSAEGTDAFLAFELPIWREIAEVELPVGIEPPTIEGAQPVFSLQLEGSLQHLRATFRCRYGDRPAFVPMDEPEKRFTLRDPANNDRLLVRNLAAEMAAIVRLEQAGFSRQATDFEMRDAGRIARFFAFDFPALPSTWETSVTPRLEKVRSDLEPVAPAIEIVRSGEDWFEMKYSVATGAGEGIPLAEVQRLLRSGQSQIRLTNGKMAVLNPDAFEDFEQVLRDADPRQSQPGIYRLKKIQAAYLTQTAEEIGARLIGASQILRANRELASLGSLETRLRDYQRIGVRWLGALAAQNLGGILADEMGLGKTIQALAHLLLDRGHGPALIVCPKSLLSNWQREATHFTPELKVLRIEGADRADKIAQLLEFDLGLTSYGLLRRDVELYAGLGLRTVILDEAQHIKNPETQNAQAAFGLNAHQRFVLTGTPMENSVRDLWSLMNFVAPGYLGSRADFRERYEKPITTNPEPALQRRLVRRLRPFLLRRRKADVARELPEKIEQVVPCDLGPAQRATYNTLLREIQQGLGANRANDGAQRMKMLTGLLRLRQTCCDLRLLGLGPGSAGDSPVVLRDPRDTSGVFGESPKTAGEVARAPQAGNRESSAKLDLLDELLEEIIDGGHRVLVFSQFVKMLDLIRERLEASEIAHCYLAGLTKDRQAQVDRFQQDETIPVFLISLKAGGVGLNLSAADTVIHFDPWWNAAVEAQATDRAHRIGQKRVVTSYKVIARDTVEEKIVNLQKRKRDLASAMLETEEPLMTGLTTEDLAELLAL
jgi:superfamily II DNA or RNA helicase